MEGMQLRDPINLNEFKKHGHTIAIWRENDDTLTYMYPHDIHSHPETPEGTLRLGFSGNGPVLYIVGRTDKAIAQTAAFFMSLDSPDNRTSSDCSVKVSAIDSLLDFIAAGSLCLQRIFEVEPSREVWSHNVELSAEQSAVLATRLHRTSLTFHDCRFKDGGTAFVDALRGRNSSFGPLNFHASVGFNDASLERLVRLDVRMIDHLDMPY